MQKDDYEAVSATAFGDETTKALFKPIWNEKGLGVKVLVEDEEVDDTDQVTLYVQLPEGGADAESVVTDTIERSGASDTEKGYETELFVE